MKTTARFVWSILLTILFASIGTVGYMLIEGWSAIDALYMTITTLATVGYGEVHPLSNAGRVFSMALIVLGVGFFFYVAAAVIQFVVEGRIRILLGRRRLDRKIARMKNHYIVCGYGRIGRVICDKLQRENFDLVVIDKNPDQIEIFESKRMVYLCADAGDEAVLVRAGLLRAKALIAALATDIDNVFLVLTARQLAPPLKIIARAGSEAAKNKLTAAGADTVEAPYEIGAATMAQRIIRPTVTNFLDLAFTQHHNDIQMEEIPVAAASALNGLMLKDSGIRQQYQLIIIAIKKADDRMLFNPSFEAELRAGDTVIAVGDPSNLKRLEAVLNPAPPRGQTAE
jgi:voltage-gated potassium channel